MYSRIATNKKRFLHQIVQYLFTIIFNKSQKGVKASLLKQKYNQFSEIGNNIMIPLFEESHR